MYSQIDSKTLMRIDILDAGIAQNFVCVNFLTEDSPGGERR